MSLSCCVLLRQERKPRQEETEPFMTATWTGCSSLTVVTDDWRAIWLCVVPTDVWPLTFMCLFSGRGGGDSAVTGSWIRTWSSRSHEEENLLLVQTVLRTPWGHFLSLYSVPSLPPSFLHYLFPLVKHHQSNKILWLLTVHVLQTSWTVWKKTKKRLNTLTEQKLIKYVRISCLFLFAPYSLFFQFDFAFLWGSFTIYVKCICHHNTFCGICKA